MRILIAYQGNNKTNQQVAETMKKVFEEHGLDVTMQAVEPAVEMRLYDYLKEFRKKKGIPLKEAILDVSNYDLVVVGTPVLKFCPTPIMETYIRELKGTKSKQFVLYCTPVGFAGTTIRRMASILTTKGAKIKATLTISSIFELNEKKLALVKEFAMRLLPKQASL